MNTTTLCNGSEIERTAYPPVDSEPYQLKSFYSSTTVIGYTGIDLLEQERACYSYSNSTESSNSCAYLP